MKFDRTMVQWEKLWKLCNQEAEYDDIPEMRELSPTRIGQLSTAFALMGQNLVGIVFNETDYTEMELAFRALFESMSDWRICELDRFVMKCLRAESDGAEKLYTVMLSAGMKIEEYHMGEVNGMYEDALCEEVFEAIDKLDEEPESQGGVGQDPSCKDAGQDTDRW